MGEDSAEVKLIASTIPEIEHLVPFLMECRDSGRPANILYGIPLPPSQTTRLANIARQLGPRSLSILVDHPAQLDQANIFYEIAQFPVAVYVKVDTGYHRAGLPPSALNKNGLLDKLTELEAAGHVLFLGLYSHSSLSYNDSTPGQAMDSLAGEIKDCLVAVRASELSLPRTKELTISVGASPQIISVLNIAGDKNGSSWDTDSANLRQEMREVIGTIVGSFKLHLELHAGVYTLLDMQQLATRAHDSLGSPQSEVAISIVAEVCSVYNRGERRYPEALLAVGTLGLGREPCHAYSGWGVVELLTGEVESHERRLIIERISQEHSIISWEMQADEKDTEVALPPIPVEPGQIVRVYPNHACVTGAMYGWYLVVDGDKDLAASKVVEVWKRASGW